MEYPTEKDTKPNKLSRVDPAGKNIAPGYTFENEQGYASTEIYEGYSSRWEGMLVKVYQSDEYRAKQSLLASMRHMFDSSLLRLRLRWLISKRILALIGGVFCALYTYHLIASSGSQTHIKLPERKSVIYNDGEPQQGSQLAPGKSKKIILFTYMRGGSTFIGSLFGVHPEAFYWYESVGLYYYQNYLEYPASISVLFHKDHSARNLPQKELDGQVNFMDDILNCRVDDLQPDAMAHAFLYASPSTRNASRDCFKRSRDTSTINCVDQNIPNMCTGEMSFRLTKGCPKTAQRARQCLREGNVTCSEDHVLSKMIKRLKCHMKTNVDGQKCVDRMRRECESTRLRVTKVHRMSSLVMEQTLRQINDSYIVYYVRDPRAIWLSRNGKISMKGLCEVMVKDYNNYLKVKEKYPNRVSFFRYEDLAADPMPVTEELFKSIDEPLVDQLKGHLEVITHSNDTDKTSNHQSFYRKDSVNASQKWRSKIPSYAIKQSQMYCRKVFDLLGYEEKI